MLLIVEKGIRGEISFTYVLEEEYSIDTQKLITNTLKIIIKIKDGNIFDIGM